MTNTIIIKDDIERAINYVRKHNPECAQPLTEMIFDHIAKLRDGGWNITYTGSVLTNRTDYVHNHTGEDNDERVFFHLFKLDQKGQAIDVVSFVAVNLTRGTVTDCSANIVSVH
ncbi:hypothetical protein D3C76_09360 [compost metagenome]